MIVRLTHSQGRVVCDFVGGRHAEFMVEHRVAYGRQQHDYLLPAIGWRQVLDRMLADAYGPLGGQKRGRSASFYTAMSRIQAEVSRREHHPALTSKAVFGVETEIIPAWLTLPGMYGPYPEPDTRFVLLVARTTEVSGHTITEWPWYQDESDWILGDPSTHWDFVMTE